MRQSHGPGNEPNDTESRQLTPSLGLVQEESEDNAGSNEDFLFHLYRGSELLQDNRVHEAKEELERALHLQPRDAKGQDLLAVVYFRLGLYPRAIHIYEQLRRKNTTDTALLLNLALCYLKTGQPQLARRDLEQLLGLNPTHTRAWGYLGLACERMGDLVQAERAFVQGGHHQMAKRLAGRRDGAPVVAMPEEPPLDEVRDVAGAAYQELDAGELSFRLAEPSNDRSSDSAAQSWLALELGQVHLRENPDGLDGHRPSLTPAQNQLNRRPTLIAPVGAPPAHEEAGYAMEPIPSQRSPSVALDDPGVVPSPSLRRPVVAVPSPFGPPRSHEALPNVHGTRTLPPPLVHPATIPPETRHERAMPHEKLRADSNSSVASGRPLAMESVATAHAPVAPSPTDEPRRTRSVRFPDAGVILDPSGLALVRVTKDVGFAARLESLRAQQSGLDMKLLERHAKGNPTGESFGGIASPMVLVSGDGQLVLAARPGRKLNAFLVGADMWFAREDVLLGFGGGLVFENGRLTTGDGEWVPVVQLRGDGSILLESIGEILSLAVRPDRSLSARREVILGWSGRLVPRSLPPSDAPCGQRGLVSFAGEGHVLIAGA